MSRSAVLRGRIDARDRARLRGRLDRPAAEDVDHHAEIRAWLGTTEYRDEDPEDMVRLDLGQYLHETGRFELPPEERLRQLAMFVEVDFGSVAPDALDRIYGAAVRLNPSDRLVWHSRGIAAQFVATVSESAETSARFETLALRYLSHAWELDSPDPEVAYSLGEWHSEFGAIEDAAEWIERAIALEPGHGDALLYRAHCLHDEERWVEAVEAYRAVPLETFEGPRAWLVDVVLEAQAYCVLRAGDRAGALREFERLLERFEREPQRAEMLALVYLTEACREPLRAELWPAYCRLARLIGLPA